MIIDRDPNICRIPPVEVSSSNRPFTAGRRRPPRPPRHSGTSNPRPAHQYPSQYLAPKEKSTGLICQSQQKEGGCSLVRRPPAATRQVFAVMPRAGSAPDATGGDCRPRATCTRGTLLSPRHRVRGNASPRFSGDGCRPRPTCSRGLCSSVLMASAYGAVYSCRGSCGTQARRLIGDLLPSWPV